MNKGRARVIDELLVIRCQAGCPESFDLLIRRWQRRLWRYAYRLTGQQAVAWDVVQETWLAILQQIGRLSDPAWFGAWAYRIVRNRCADHHRSARRQSRLIAAAVERGRPGSAPTRRDSAHDIAEALRHLPPDLREPLTLKYGEDLNIIEIALILGIPAGTVKSRLHRARQALRRCLQGEHP